MGTEILELEVPGLARRLRALTEQKQEAIIVKAALFAAERLSEAGAKTRATIDSLRSGGGLTAEGARAALNLSEETDDEYLDLQEKGAPEKKWKNLFREARLLRGIAVGFGASEREDVADAFYELTKACENSNDLVHLINDDLGAG